MLLLARVNYEYNRDTASAPHRRPRDSRYDTEFGSSKVRAAVSKEMPCFRRLVRFFLPSHARTMCIYKIVALAWLASLGTHASEEADFSLMWNCDFADAETRSGIIQEKMPVTIPDEVLKAAHITESELNQELALALFQQERLTLAQASRLAGLGQLAFQALLAERRIPIHYGVAEFREDLQALRLTDRL